MATLIEITPVKTYKTKENAAKAADKLYGNIPELRYFIKEHLDGHFKTRYFPVFVGTKALEYGVHFNFNIIA